jgi:hypothetical protein
MQTKSLVVLASLGMGNGKNSPATPKNAVTYQHGFLNIFRN